MNIILIGFMGVGKTSVGKVLADKLNLTFFDTDFEIEKKYGKIDYIFEKFGQDYFRTIETDELNNLLSKDNLVISTGGGIVLENFEILKKNCNVIFLDASVDTIFNNLVNDKNKRPLLKNKNLKENIENLLYKRYNLYTECSNFKINTNNKNIYQIVDQIIDTLDKGVV